jgi:hypothetical protein
LAATLCTANCDTQIIVPVTNYSGHKPPADTCLHAADDFDFRRPAAGMGWVTGCKGGQRRALRAVPTKPQPCGPLRFAQPTTLPYDRDTVQMAGYTDAYVGSHPPGGVKSRRSGRRDARPER